MVFLHQGECRAAQRLHRAPAGADAAGELRLAGAQRSAQRDDRERRQQRAQPRAQPLRLLFAVADALERERLEDGHGVWNGRRKWREMALSHLLHDHLPRHDLWIDQRVQHMEPAHQAFLEAVAGEDRVFVLDGHAAVVADFDQAEMYSAQLITP